MGGGEDDRVGGDPGGEGRGGGGGSAGGPAGAVVESCGIECLKDPTGGDVHKLEAGGLGCTCGCMLPAWA